MSDRIETIAEDHNLCGEAPIWDSAQRRLIWTDLSSSVVYQFYPESNTKEIVSRGLMAAGIALNRDGALIFAGATGLHLWHDESHCRTVLQEDGGESLFFNDIVSDAGGRIYAGTMYWGEAGMEKYGKLYLIKTDGSACVVADGLEMSNGLGFSPDQRTLYHADSSTRRMYASNVDRETGSLSERRLFVQVSAVEGLPDGLTVDSEGFVWSAQWYGGSVVRYDPDGHMERRIDFPVRQISSVAFGAKDLTDLYVTSAAESWVSNYAPAGYDFHAPNMGGSLYRIHLDVAGQREHVADISL